MPSVERCAFIRESFFGGFYSTGSRLFQITYMCLQVARAGRFGTKGLSVTFVSDETDAKILNSVQDRFEVNITVLPAEIDVSSYSKQL